MERLKVLAEHENEFGDKPKKAVNDFYDAPATAAQALVANGYAKRVAADAKAAHAAKKEG